MGEKKEVKKGIERGKERKLTKKSGNLFLKKVNRINTVLKFKILSGSFRDIDIFGSSDRNTVTCKSVS